MDKDSDFAQYAGPQPQGSAGESPDRNLDVLHERTASGKPTQEQEDLRRGRALRGAEELMIASGSASIMLVLDEAGDWSAALDLGNTGSNGYGASLKNAIDDAVGKAG